MIICDCRETQQINRNAGTLSLHACAVVPAYPIYLLCLLMNIECRFSNFLFLENTLAKERFLTYQRLFLQFTNIFHTIIEKNSN